jgi:peptide-methionine (S)-S-oxide reductase
VGTQFRSAIFYADDRQKEIAQRYIDQLNQSKAFGKPIATKVTLLENFYPAEDYHQNYLALHPNEPYIVFNDLPKVEQLKKDFPSWYR